MPYWLAPWEIAWKHRLETQLFPSVSRCGNAEKKCRKRVNTRENGQMHASTSLWLQSAAHTHSIVLSGNFWCSSFSLLKVSQGCSQLIHMRFVPVLARGSAGRIKNAANARGNNELSGKLCRQCQPARDATNSSTRPDYFFSFYAVRVSD